MAAAKTCACVPCDGACGVQFGVIADDIPHGSLCRYHRKRSGVTYLNYRAVFVEICWLLYANFKCALYTVPKELLEAAAQCGANQWQIFTKIQLPLLHAPLAVSLLFAFLNSFKIFREVYLIGGAYPNNNLYSLQHFLSNNFSNMNFSRLAAASVLVIAVVCLALTLLWRVLKRAERMLR